MTGLPPDVNLLDGLMVTATVTRPVPEARDALGVSHRGEPETDTVPGVLVDTVEGSGEQVSGAGDERHQRAVLVLHFPTTYDRPLAGCAVTISDDGCPSAWRGTWQVVGDPLPYDPRLCPGPWNRKVRVVAHDL